MVRIQYHYVKYVMQQCHYRGTYWLVHWPSVGGLLHLVQQRAWMGEHSTQYTSHCTKCYQCTNFVLVDVMPHSIATVWKRYKTDSHLCRSTVSSLPSVHCCWRLGGLHLVPAVQENPFVNLWSTHLAKKSDPYSSVGSLSKACICSLESCLTIRIFQWTPFCHLRQTTLPK